MRPAVLTRAIPAFAVALLIAFAPLANDLCARTCEAPADAACPVHSPKPAPRCTHDHGVMSADLRRAASSTPTLAGQPSAIAVSPPFWGGTSGADLTQSRLLRRPPHIAEPLPALRI
jgi:hypothetical protein